MLTEVTNYYNDTAVFEGGKDSLNVAFSLFSMSYGDFRFDDSYGSFYATSYTEGWDQDGEWFRTSYDHNFHLCSKEELGLEGENSQFFPIEASYRQDVENDQYGHLYCLDDPSELQLWGISHSQHK